MDEVTKYAGDDQELLETLREFLINRATPPKANPVKTAYGIKRILKRLETLSNGQRSVQLTMLDNSIRGNWRDVFALKPDELDQLKQKSEEPSGGSPRYVRTDIIDGREVDIYA